MPTFNIYMPLVFLFIIITFLSLKTEAAPEYRYHICPNTSTYSPNSTYQSNLNLVLSSLSSNATNDNGFYNITAGRDRQDTVYGLFLCRGDVTADICRDCVAKATSEILKKYCPNERTAIIWYDLCMLRYDNQTFFSDMEDSPSVSMWNEQNVTEQSRLNQIVYDTMSNISTRAASDQSGKKFATDEANFTAPYNTIYNLVQCTPDISAADCNRCLQTAVAVLPNCCSGKQGGNVLLSSCNIRYEVYQFYGVSAEAFPDAYFCSNTSYSPNSAYQSNLNLVLSSLSSKATNHNGFYNVTAGHDPQDRVYGLFLCRGDVTAEECQDCVANATSKILQKYCPKEKTAIIWYDMCMLRYEDRSFFSVMEDSPNMTIWDSQSVTEQSIFNLISKVYTTMNKISTLAASDQSGKKFATDEANFTAPYNTIYNHVQCTPDITADDCLRCLTTAINSLPLLKEQEGKVGGVVLFPSCNIRYEVFQYYHSLAAAPAPTPPEQISSSSSSNTGNSSRRIIIIVVATVLSVVVLSTFYFCFIRWKAIIFVVATVLSTFYFCFIRWKARKKDEAIKEENVENEITTMRSLQFELGTIEAATNNFSADNMIGKGGFGSVYKGTLSNGQEIAVKRLSRGSRQGVQEFKNEVVLVAKLQHRNLVRLLGSCVGGEEKILIYEFVPNRSLDYFLFDPKKQAQLDWLRRYKIIAGIVRGMLYLHEYSRLRIIHRDLKASNVLLDGNMDPKISDFGLARIVGVDHTRGITNRIVGTYGYMSPEYAIRGHFSTKSDVFSFGVLVLEIISGKKNNSFYQSDYVENLRSYAWKHWRDGTPLELMDPTLTQSYSRNEVIRCVQIGLLCVEQDPANRPTMQSIASMLVSSVSLPLPQQPALFAHSRTESYMPVNKSVLLSVNEASVTELYPR